MTKKTKYVDNEELYNLLIQWKEDKKQNIRMSERLCSLFLLMCDGVISKPTYTKIDITTKEDLKSNAMLNLILYIHNFNHEKSKSKNSAFTYVTFSIETSIKGQLKKMKEKENRLEILYNSDILDSFK